MTRRPGQQLPAELGGGATGVSVTLTHTLRGCLGSLLDALGQLVARVHGPFDEPALDRPGRRAGALRVAVGPANRELYFRHRYANGTGWAEL